jgi:hypothetical protein
MQAQSRPYIPDKRMSEYQYYEFQTADRRLSEKSGELPKSYDLAMQHLVDLRDLAVRKGADADFSQRLALLREAHSRKPSFIGRLQDKGLGS